MNFTRGFFQQQDKMFTIQFIPYSEIEGLSSSKKIEKLLNIVRENKIVLMEGRLERKEEAELIKRTMEKVNCRFSGIEVSVIYPEDKSTDVLKRVKNSLAGVLLGYKQGLTIIGPATMVREIKREKRGLKLQAESKRIKK